MALPFWENVSGRAPQQGTTVACGWNAEGLFVQLICEDSDPWATITERDGPLWSEEVVEIFLDPVGDGECYFEIEINPLGTVLDLVLRRNRSGYRKDFSWKCDGLQTGVARTATGWTVDAFIPFASVVPQPPGSGDEWRVNFTRIDRPKGQERELSAWEPTLLHTFHAPERFGALKFA